MDFKLAMLNVKCYNVIENSVESDRFSLIGVPVFYLGETNGSS